MLIKSKDEISGVFIILNPTPNPTRVKPLPGVVDIHIIFTAPHVRHISFVNMCQPGQTRRPRYQSFSLNAAPAAIIHTSYHVRDICQKVLHRCYCCACPTNTSYVLSTNSIPTTADCPHDRCTIQFPELESLSSRHEVLETTVTIGLDCEI